MFIEYEESKLKVDLPAQEAMGKFTIEKDIAQHIKRTVCPPPPPPPASKRIYRVIARPDANLLC